MNNIDIFNLVAGEILGNLYSVFPNSTSIDSIAIGNLIKRETGVEFDENDINMGNPEIKFVDNTLSWLIQAGYIWAEHPHVGPGFSNSRLSPLGLEILKSVPESINSNETFGQSLSRGFKEIGMKSFSDLVSSLLKLGVTNAFT